MIEIFSPKVLEPIFMWEKMATRFFWQSHEIVEIHFFFFVNIFVAFC